MPPKGWKKEPIQPVQIEYAPTAKEHHDNVQDMMKPTPSIEVNPKPNIIQPISVEVTQSQKPTRTSQPTKSTPHKTGAFLVDSVQNKRTWMDRSMANLMAKSNAKRYSVED